MAIVDRIELVAGVCPLLYKADNPDSVLITRELRYKEQTGKLAGMLGFGYESVEEGESYRDATLRYFQEELKPVAGKMYIPDDLEASTLCITRISPPEMQAWVHAFSIPVSSDFEAVRGSEVDEIDGPWWVDARKILQIERTKAGSVFRCGTFEIALAHMVKLKNTDFNPKICDTPINLPDWRLYRLMEEGFSQNEAMCRVGLDPQLLANSQELVRLLQ